MSFVEFYHQFINEGFINHGTVKYRAMGATNKVFRGMLNGIKNIPDNLIDIFEHMIIGSVINRAVSVTQSFEDLESYNDVIENEVAPTIKQAFNLVRQKKPSLETLWTWYVLFSAGLAFVNIKNGQTTTLVEDQEEGFLFLPQDLERKYNNGEVTKRECSLKGLFYYGGKIAVKKQGGVLGSWNSLENKITLVLPCLSFQSNAKNTYILGRKSSIEANIHRAINIYERLSNRQFFITFVNQLQTELKTTLSHEVTHAWQKWRRYKTPEKTYVGHDAEELENYVPTQYQGEITTYDLPYLVSEEEIESRRSDAQLKYKKGFGDYIDCVCASDYRKGESYKQLVKTYGNGKLGIIRTLLFFYYYFIVLPKEHTFQEDLKKHTKKTRSGTKYTGSYKQYMEDYENFYNGSLFRYSPDDVKNIAKNFIRVIHLISRNIHKIKNRTPLQDFKEMYIPALADDFWLEVYGNSDIIDNAKEAIKKACSL